jgi:hypothetical protein
MTTGVPQSNSNSINQKMISRRQGGEACRERFQTVPYKYVEEADDAPGNAQAFETVS